MYGITEIVPTFCNNIENIAGAWLHEVTRTLIDRFLSVNEQNAVFKLTKTLCAKIFGVDEYILFEELPDPHFHYFYHSLAEKYVEMSDKE